MNRSQMEARLFSLQDTTYRDFVIRLIPNLAPDTVIGVRTPALRALAKEIGEDAAFLGQLPHRYFEENQLHCLLLGNGKDFEKTVGAVEAFLPYVDNWATCDQLRIRVFSRHRAEMLPYIHRWLDSGQVYTIRFAIEMLMTYYLDTDFSPEYPALVASVRHDDYYVRMMVAWYFATALAKQYPAVLPYITQYRLEPWIHNKTIQKCVESHRITQEQKEFLKKYRLK